MRNIESVEVHLSVRTDQYPRGSGERLHSDQLVAVLGRLLQDSIFCPQDPSPVGGALGNFFADPIRQSRPSKRGARVPKPRGQQDRGDFAQRKQQGFHGDNGHDRQDHPDRPRQRHDPARNVGGKRVWSVRRSAVRSTQEQDRICRIRENPLAYRVTKPRRALGKDLQACCSPACSPDQER